MFVLATAPHARAEPTAREIAKLLPAGSGLVAAVGFEDAREFTNLAATGRVLVHVLADDRQKRDALRESIRDAGQYGAVSVETVFDRKRLPYCDGLVNVLTVGRSSRAGRELAADEIGRVLAPGGSALVREGASTRTIHKSIDSALGEWTHQNGNAGNNPVSGDRTLAPVSTVRWIDGFARTIDSFCRRASRALLCGCVYRLVGDGPRRPGVDDAWRHLSALHVPRVRHETAVSSLPLKES